MSLINDALKRAQQSQPSPSHAAHGVPLRPIELAPRPEDHSLFSLPFLVTVLVLLGGFLVFNFSTESAVQVRARSHRPIPPVPTTPVPVATTPVIPTNPIVASVTEPTTNATAVIDPAKPQPYAYKLQGIVFNPKHPSAMINGFALYVGERVGDARVTSITKDTVTIVTVSGETRVLDLFH